MGRERCEGGRAVFGQTKGEKRQGGRGTARREGSARHKARGRAGAAAYGSVAIWYWPMLLRYGIGLWQCCDMVLAYAVAVAPMALAFALASGP